MKPYYKDDLITIYNNTSHIFNSDIVILDPPQQLDARIFKAKVYIIFCGALYPFYEEQFPDMKCSKVAWQYRVRGYKGVDSDTILIAGSKVTLGMGLYTLPPYAERANQWERSLELMLNLLTENEGNVLDPFMGSGNSMVACKKLGKKGIGFELEECLCKVAAERCRKV